MWQGPCNRALEFYLDRAGQGARWQQSQVEGELGLGPVPSATCCGDAQPLHLCEAPSASPQCCQWNESLSLDAQSLPTLPAPVAEVLPSFCRRVDLAGGARTGVRPSAAQSLEMLSVPTPPGDIQNENSPHLNIQKFTGACRFKCFFLEFLIARF